MERCLVRALDTGVQVSMPTSRSYLKDSSTYSFLSNGVLGRWYPVFGGGEGDLDGASEGVLNLYRSMCGDGEEKEKGSVGDFRLNRQVIHSFCLLKGFHTRVQYLTSSQFTGMMDYKLPAWRQLS